MNRVRSFYALGMFLGALGVLALATNSGGQKPPKPAESLPGDLVIGEPIAFQNLTVFPVSSKSPRMEDRFITLDEGLASGKVEIVEKGAPSQTDPSETSGSAAADNQDPFAEPGQQAAGGNDVNELIVVNRSERPLYLMPGEIIVGGDQDRTIGRELVVAADGKPVALDVYCVEHGRWGRRADAE